MSSHLYVILLFVCFVCVVVPLPRRLSPKTRVCGADHTQFPRPESH